MYNFCIRNEEFCIGHFSVLLVKSWNKQWQNVISCVEKCFLLTWKQPAFRFYNFYSIYLFMPFSCFHLHHLDKGGTAYLSAIPVPSHLSYGILLISVCAVCVRQCSSTLNPRLLKGPREWLWKWAKAGGGGVLQVRFLRSLLSLPAEREEHDSLSY